ncbi:hypothetical protein EMA8858_03834 [Emticicia aquatica]|jgi:hypothetical protein|uniref:PqqD family protein n=1 Tax=Emticicia aquatica TaxID=1681835 RepID=A0ABM9AVE7_9BACT|nr:PqqD family protein [Emticicia aquatica]CAH0997700.1 hypothetical protein EMA8858_03834 [Emticicia aquatica]
MNTFKVNHDKILFTQLGEEGVIFDIEKNDYITLNETFFKILQSIEQGKNQNEIVIDFCKEYDISEEDCRTDVNTAIEQLLDKQFVIL